MAYGSILYGLGLMKGTGGDLELAVPTPPPPPVVLRGALDTKITLHVSLRVQKNLLINSIFVSAAM